MRHSHPQLPRFRRQVQALIKAFPLLAGSLVRQYVICGKSGCHCQRGEKHGPLYYLYWKERGRSRSLYVPREKVGELRQQIRNYRHLQKELGSRVRRQLREWQTTFRRNATDDG